MKRDEERALYDATRRLSLLFLPLMDCPIISEKLRVALRAWFAAIPDAWWKRFPLDDTREHH